MLFDIIKAIVIAGIPIAVISYYFIIWTTSRIEIKAKNAKQLKLELKGTKVDKTPEDNMVQHMLHKKWLRFGGGFYGVLTFITYIHIEVYQLVQFVANFPGFQPFVDSLGFSTIIWFFIEALTNLITAFMWPIYWFRFLPIDSFWIWFIVVFFAHASATKYALSKRVIRDTKN